MVHLRSFITEIAATHAVWWLASHGVRAAVVKRTNAMDNRNYYEVALAEKADLTRARQLLEEAANTPIQLEENWEDQSTPDLSLLDPELALPCPECGSILPLDALLEACPACDADVDVTELLVAAHGPEILNPCYPDELGEHLGALLADLAQAPTVHLNCPRCRHELDNLPVLGPCPGCGTGYDKRELLRRSMGDR